MPLVRTNYKPKKCVIKFEFHLNHLLNSLSKKMGDQSTQPKTNPFNPFNYLLNKMKIRYTIVKH